MRLITVHVHVAARLLNNHIVQERCRVVSACRMKTTYGDYNRVHEASTP